MKNNLGSNIKKFRKNKGFTQEELAEILGVTPQAVSRWESESGLPDVSMIIPIAQVLGVTTDALLGYDKLQQDDSVTQRVMEKVTEMDDASDKWGSCLKICEYLATESNKNPTNYEILTKYVQRVASFSMYVDLEGFLKDEPEKAKAIYEDGIRKGIQIIRYCNDTRLVDKAHYVIAWIYIHRKDFANAREHINVLPSLSSNTIRESINMELVFFENGFDAMKDSIVETNRIMFNVVAKQLQVIAQDYGYFADKDDAIAICDWCTSLLNAYAERKEFTTDHLLWARKKIILYRIVAYSRNGEQEEAKAVYHSFLNEIQNSSELSNEQYHALVKEMEMAIKPYL